MQYTSPSGNIYTLYKTMSEQNHLLIAGATGSGKSVVINGIIATALYRMPDEAQFILLDPKRVELSTYSALPHCIAYASEPADMIRALDYAMEITENRYKWMQAQGLKKYPGGDIYVIIDEYADLMTTNKKDTQPLIQRLCQIGRAARVHVIAATQCPTREVITTAIKVNFDSRVALRTANGQQSRNIIDEKGCETFPDPRTAKTAFCYFRHGAELNLYRVPMIPDDEINRLINWWLAQAPQPKKPIFQIIKNLFTA